MMLWHAAMAWYFITPGLVLWAVDHLLRLNNCLGINITIESIEVEGSGNVVSIGYTVSYLRDMIAGYFRGKHPQKRSSLDHLMGQYCFINIPQISPLEWHPFSISCSPVDGVTTHHIKSMGQQQWTGKLLDLAYEINNGVSGRSLSQLVLNIDGPYGVSMPVHMYSRICLVAGGIGVTPLHSYLRHMYLCLKESQGKVLSYDDNDKGFMPSFSRKQGSGQDCAFSHLKQIRLIWIVRSEAESMLFDKTLQLIENDNLGGLFSYAIYITRGDKTEATSWRHGAFLGRPDMKAEISEFASDSNESLVFACGPKALVELVSDLSIKANIDFKHETFEL